MSYGCEKLVLPGFYGYPMRKFRYTDTSRLGWYDVIIIIISYWKVWKTDLLTDWLTDHGMLVLELLAQQKVKSFHRLVSINCCKNSASIKVGQFTIYKFPFQKNFLSMEKFSSWEKPDLPNSEESFRLLWFWQFLKYGDQVVQGEVLSCLMLCSLLYILKRFFF